MILKKIESFKKKTRFFFNKSKKIIEKNFILFSLTVLIFNIYFGRYIAAVFYLIFAFYFVLRENPVIKKHLEAKLESDTNLYYHYMNEKYLKSIYIFTRSVYFLAFVNFICQGLPIFIKYNVYITCVIIFAIVLDLIACLFIIYYRNPFTRVLHFIETWGPKVVTVMIPTYVTYANINPTQEISHYFHLWGPKKLGALGAAPNSKLQLEQLDHINTVGSRLALSHFCDQFGAPNLPKTIYAIHANPDEYLKWKSHLPKPLWPIYGLDSPRGDVVTKDLLDQLKNQGEVPRTVLFEEFQNEIKSRKSRGYRPE